jgi:hypothetical protein
VTVDQAPPTTATVYQLTQPILDETWELLREPGAEGLEGVVLWLGRMSAADRADVLAPFFPPQIAYRSEDGLAVEVPQDALTQIIGALPAGVRILARVHSHPTGAYHSRLDDRNMIIGHEGAISIVVPHFAMGPSQLLACSVNQLERARGWRALSLDEIRTRFAFR